MAEAKKKPAKKKAAPKKAESKKTAEEQLEESKVESMGLSEEEQAKFDADDQTEVKRLFKLGYELKAAKASKKHELNPDKLQEALEAHDAYESRKYKPSRKLVREHKDSLMKL